MPEDDYVLIVNVAGVFASDQKMWVRRKRSQSPTILARSDRTWAEAARASPRSNSGIAVRLPTYHTVKKDLAIPYPSVANPHLLITGRYSSSIDNQNEIVFMHMHPAGQAATRELL